MKQIKKAGGDEEKIAQIKACMKQDVINELKYSWNNKVSYFYEPENADVKAAVDGAVLENNKEFLDEADRLFTRNITRRGVYPAMVVAGEVCRPGTV